MKCKNLFNSSWEEELITKKQSQADPVENASITISQLSCGFEHACVLYTNSTTECIGRKNTYKEINLDSKMSTNVQSIKAAM